MNFMEDRCVIDYHQLEMLKNLLDSQYGTDLSRAYLKHVFNGLDIAEEIRSYGVDDPIILANAQLILAGELGVTVEAIDKSLLEESAQEFLN
jgi:hypothetical protein